MELKQTATMIQSEDYRERFKAEYYQTAIRRDKLAATVDKLDAGKLEFKNDSTPDQLKRQLAIMDEYVAILKERAATEGIGLAPV